MKNYPHILAVVYIIVLALSAINPHGYDIWFVEIFPIAVIFFTLVFTYKYFQFSNIAYSFMMVLLILHTIGAHYTFANVPFGYITELFNFERNHFDRMAHFSVGFYAYPMAEFLLKKNLATFKTVLFFALFFIMSVAGAYEIIEWWFAVAEGGDVGIEFLGSQGDVWDAQKDMLADTLGAIFSLIVFYFINKNSYFESPEPNSKR